MVSLCGFYWKLLCSQNQMPDQSTTLVILDLDETLIHSSEELIERQPDSTVGPFYVYFRPFLHDFLLRIHQQFEIAVWSSSSLDYALAIVAAAFPTEVDVKFIWGRERCIQRFDPEWQSTYFVKDLRKVSRIGYDINRILIIDDTPQKVERNYGNAIYVEPYYGTLADRELQYLSHYLDSIQNVANVRNIEKRSWKQQSQQ